MAKNDHAKDVNAVNARTSQAGPLCMILIRMCLRRVGRDRKVLSLAISEISVTNPFPPGTRNTGQVRYNFVCLDYGTTTYKHSELGLICRDHAEIEPPP